LDDLEEKRVSSLQNSRASMGKAAGGLIQAMERENTEEMRGG